jgi:flagellin
VSLTINTNVTALTALNNLTKVSNDVAGSIQKLSSGLRINQAADDPSGLIISEALRAQIDGLNQAVSNSQDATNLIKTSEGALTEVNSLLRNVRQLAVHAANTGVNDQVAVQADQTQIASAISSIQRIAEQTQFGTKRLLDGSSGISAAVVDTKNIAGINIGGVFNNLTTQSGTVNVTLNGVATRAQVSGAALATYASVNASISTVNGLKTGNGGSVVLNGQTISVSGSDTVQTLINKINNLAGTTGVSADFTSGNGSGAILLTQQNYGSNFAINESESSTLLTGTGSPTLVKGSNATVTVITSALVNGVVTSVVATFTGGRSSTDSGLKVTDTYGNSILLQEAFQSTYVSPTGSPQLTVSTITAGNLQFQIGGNAGQTVTASLGNIRTNNLGNTTIAGQSLSLIDVTTATGATNAITITDEAIGQVTQLRANLGSFQKNTLESTIRYLGVGVENLSASESQIRDTNVASEVVKLTKNQIIQSAANSVLAQANQAPQSVLSLLK